MAEGSSQDVLRRLREGGRHDREFGTAIATLIYLRWVDFQESEQEAIASFDGTDYRPALPAFLHWRSWCDLRQGELSAFLKERLPSELRSLQNNRYNPLATHLYRAAKPLEVLSRFTPDELATMVHWLAEQPFETPGDRRQLLNSFDDFLNATTYRLSGEYRTPPGIADLIVELASPSIGDRVYDPCFGSAGLLTAACDHVLRKEKDLFSRSSAPALTISGVERNPDSYIIGLTRLALAGIDDPQLELGNSLERTPSSNPQRDGFDVVLANPPWGMRADRAGLDHFPVRTTDATGLFIQHAISMLRPHGRAVIVVPQGILFRGGPEQRLRRMLLEQHTVDAVVSLPQGVFLPYTGIQASLLVLRRGGPTKSIRMVDAEPFFEKGKGRQAATIRAERAEQLARHLRAPDPSEHCWDVDTESLAEVGWDFTPRRRDQSGLLRVLDSLRSEVEVLPLKECCSILTGRAIKSSDLIDAPVGEVPIPYVRIKDVQRGQATKGSSWLSPAAAGLVDAKWKLRTGDVLISRSGTIGKAGVARNGAVGAIAANGLFALRPDQDRLDPHFLVAYLDSSECRAWLDDKARGATIRHLSKRTIEEIPVPLPPLQIQHHVAAQYREHGVDVLTFLAQLLTEREDDPIPKWIDHALLNLKSEKNTLFSVGELESLFRSKSVDTVFHRFLIRDLAKGARENALAWWFFALEKAVKTLCHFADVPPGPASYSLLQQALDGLREAEGTITGDLPNEKKASELTRAIEDRVSKAMEALASDVHVSVLSSTSRLPTGELSNIDLTLVNHATLPLRDVRVWTKPDWGHLQIGYLGEGASKTFSVSGIAPREEGKFTLYVEWSGLSLSGIGFRSQREISFDVVAPADTGKEEMEVLGGSPYVCGDPIQPERNDVFFGREDLLEQIRRQIIHSGNVVLLEGNRRAGKSSILWHLEGPSAIPGWMGIYCSLQGAEGSREGVGVPTVEVFREIAKSIAASLHKLGGETPLPDGSMLPPGKKLGIAKACRDGINEVSAFSDLRDYAEVALEKLAEHDLGLLLMLDEFDKLQEGIDSGVTSPQVPENIRFLVQTYPRFSAILTGMRRLKRLREEYWSALYGLGTRFGVTSLPEEPARQLIIEPVKGRLTYAAEAVNRAIYLTSGQPYILQCLCNRVFDIAAQLKIRSVTLDLVDQASNALVEDNEHFANLWDYAMSDRRRFILALCQRDADSPDPFRLGVIQERLLSHGVEVDDETLIADLEFLRELELIEMVGESTGGHYVMAIPLMGTWIEKQQDFAALMKKARSETEDQHG